MSFFTFSISALPPKVTSEMSQCNKEATSDVVDLGVRLICYLQVILYKSLINYLGLGHSSCAGQLLGLSSIVIRTKYSNHLKD